MSALTLSAIEQNRPTLNKLSRLSVSTAKFNSYISYIFIRISNTDFNHFLIINFILIGPGGVQNVKQDIDANNITLSWNRPTGRIESYNIKWTAIDRIPIESDEEEGENETDFGKSELLRGEKVVTQDVWEEIVKIPIFPLMSGVAYTINVDTISYGMKGDDYNTTIRTCELIFLLYFTKLKPIF